MNNNHYKCCLRIQERNVELKTWVVHGCSIYKYLHHSNRIGLESSYKFNSKSVPQFCQLYCFDVDLELRGVSGGRGSKSVYIYHGKPLPIRRSEYTYQTSNLVLVPRYLYCYKKAKLNSVYFCSIFPKKGEH